MKLNFGVGVAGEFSLVVRKADGTVKQAIPTQNNLITDKGLALLSFNRYVTTGGSVSPTNDIMYQCIVGSGSSTPKSTDTALDNAVKLHETYTNVGTFLEQPNEKHPNHVKLGKTVKYIFRNIDNKNITEVGLCYSVGSSLTNYALFTRALVKDPSGVPTSVTVLADETLEITYTFSQYYDIRQQSGEVNLLQKNSTGGTIKTDVLKYVMQHFGYTENTYISYGQEQNSYVYPKAYGVKESDSELTADYDFSQVTPFTTSVSKSSITDILSKITTGYNNGQSGSTYAYDNKSSAFRANDGVLFEVIERANNSQRIRITVNYGVMNFANGIRALTFNTSYGGNGKFSTLVVFANKENGQGIKKQNTERFSFEVLTTVAPYSELP